MSIEHKTLFTPIPPHNKLHPKFKQMMDAVTSKPARWMMEQVFSDFQDVDGNFVEQFQTTGFNARFFELYLYAYLSRSGFQVAQPGTPDFLATKNGLTVAIEASTTNPSQEGPLATGRKKLDEMNNDELQEYIRDEYPIRLGSVLFSKLRKKYWELDHCKDIPLVLAVEAFHEESVWGLTDSSIIRYLFGVEQSACFSSDAKLNITTSSVEKHAYHTKEIPSGFFFLEGAENISAVLFTNSGTHAKFTRMGYQYGVGCDRLCVSRAGYCADPEPSAMDPTFFAYDMDDPPIVETWGQGLSVFHNPKCRWPLPSEFFVDVASHVFRDNQLVTTYFGWHPRSSTTRILDLRELKETLRSVPLKMNTVSVSAVPRQQFEAATCSKHRRSLFLEEIGWYADQSESFYGTVFRDRTDSDFGYAILARDGNFEFRCIHTECELVTREEAVKSLQLKIMNYLQSPKRLFDKK